MRQPNSQLLTYSAQVRQNSKILTLPILNLRDKSTYLNTNQELFRVHIAHRFLPIKLSKKRGTSHKAIAITGIVLVAAWEELNRSTGEWSMVVGFWRKLTRCILSPSHAGERKSAMSMPTNTTENGLTGFWMRVDAKLNVRTVNGTMYKLLNARKGFILTHILSRHMHRQILRSVLYAKRKNRRADNTKSSYPKVYGLIGLKARSKSRGWASNTTLLVSKAQRAQAAMSPNTYLNPPFSRLSGLPDGSALDTVNHFLKRRKGKPTQ